MFKLSLRDIIYLILYSIPNTILSFGILYIINTAVSGKEFPFEYAGFVFTGVIVLTYLLNIIFQKGLNKYAYRILYDNEKKIFEKILKTPLITLDKLGAQRFYAVVEDIRVFAFLPGTITHTVNALLMLMLCMVYLFTLSVVSALIVVGILILLGGAYFYVITAMSKKILTLREYNETYYKYVDDVVKGFKELKMSITRRTNLLKKYLYPNRDKAEKVDFVTNYIFLSVNLISQYGLYLVIGIVLFLLPETGLLEREDVATYVVILLFAIGPVNTLINMQSDFTKFIASNKRIKKFLNDFGTKETEPNPEDLKTPKFNSLEFNNISFAYENEFSAKVFALGPVNLTIEKGETIFIVGGNGSGKSTFVNVLTGLYTPLEGDIILNKESKPNIKTELQNLMAVVFTNNHIFSHNYDDYGIENNKQYSELLSTMKLDNVITDDKEQSARRNFSKGQSKRMSMIFALLENRPVLVLDEWAADQDPHFRKYFYEVLIPELKKQGKTIIAVTHDDAYFNQADRIIKFDYGQIVKDIKIKDGQKVVEHLWNT